MSERYVPLPEVETEILAALERMKVERAELHRRIDATYDAWVKSFTELAALTGRAIDIGIAERDAADSWKPEGWRPDEP